MIASKEIAGSDTSARGVSSGLVAGAGLLVALSRDLAWRVLGRARQGLGGVRLNADDEGVDIDAGSLSQLRADVGMTYTF